LRTAWPARGQSGGRTAAIESVGCWGCWLLGLGLGAGDAGSCCRSSCLHPSWLSGLPIWCPAASQSEPRANVEVADVYPSLDNPCAYSALGATPAANGSRCHIRHSGRLGLGILPLRLPLLSLHSPLLDALKNSTQAVPCPILSNASPMPHQCLTSCPCLSSSCSPPHRRHSPASMPRPH